MKSSSDLKKEIFQKNFFFKKQLSLKTRASEKVPYHKGSKASLYHTSMNSTSSPEQF